MLKRTISGACFVAVIAGFFCLKEFVDSRLFSILIWFCCGIGTMELARAVKDFTGKRTYILSIVYGILFVPTFAVVEYFIGAGLGIYALAPVLFSQWQITTCASVQSLLLAI